MEAGRRLIVMEVNTIHSSQSYILTGMCMGICVHVLCIYGTCMCGIYMFSVCGVCGCMICVVCEYMCGGVCVGVYKCDVYVYV